MVTGATSHELVNLWAALAILAGVAAIAYSSIDSAAATLGWVEHTGMVVPANR
jgi:hypothetical protein